MPTSVTYVTEEHLYFATGALAYLALSILGGGGGVWDGGGGGGGMGVGGAEAWCLRKWDWT